MTKMLVYDKIIQYSIKYYTNNHKKKIYKEKIRFFSRKFKKK